MLQKPPANYHTAFTRQRSLVRSQHRPLDKSLYLRLERKLQGGDRGLPLTSHRRAARWLGGGLSGRRLRDRARDRLSGRQDDGVAVVRDVQWGSL